MSVNALLTSMRALVLDLNDKPYSAGHGFELRSVPTPRFNEESTSSDADQVLLKTLYAGVCGSDKGLWHRNAFTDVITNSLKRDGKSWRIPGHEFLGEIVSMGRQAREKFSLRPGDVVAAESHLYCGQCYQCQHGEKHVCDKQLTIGFSYDGCFAEYIKLPANVLWSTNLKKIRPEVAAIQEPLGNAVHVCSTVDLRGKTVLISGCGTIGLFATVLARNLGAKTIIGVDTNAKQLDFAKQLGADYVIQSEARPGPESDHALVSKIREWTTVGVDVAMEMAGFNSSLNNVIQATRRGGSVILFGIKSGDFVVSNYEQIVLDGKTLHGVVGRRLFDTWKLTQELLENKPDIQEKIFNVILKGGKETVLNFVDFTPEKFETLLSRHMKLIFKF